MFSAVTASFAMGDPTGTISTLEAFWMLLGVLGLVVALLNFREALRDRAAVAGRNERLRIVARGNIRREGYRIVNAVAVCAVSVTAMLTPNTQHPASRVVAIAVTLFAVCVVSSGFNSRQTRLRSRTAGQLPASVSLLSEHRERAA